MAIEIKCTVCEAVVMKLEKGSKIKPGSKGAAAEAFAKNGRTPGNDLFEILKGWKP